MYRSAKSAGCVDSVELLRIRRPKLAQLPVSSRYDWADHLALPHHRESRRWRDGCGLQGPKHKLWPGSIRPTKKTTGCTMPPCQEAQRTEIPSLILQRRSTMTYHIRTKRSALLAFGLLAMLLLMARSGKAQAGQGSRPLIPEFSTAKAFDVSLPVRDLAWRGAFGNDTSQIPSDAQAHRCG